ncbi:hypothetical protein D9M68_825780 [compost metagenome]
MLQNTIYKHRHIRSTTTDIHNGYTRFQVIISQYGRCRCQRLQYQVFSIQICTFHAALDIFDGRFIAGDDMEVGTEFSTVHPDYRALRNIGNIVYREFCRNNINNLITCRDVCLALVAHQHFNLFFSDNLFRRSAYPVTT